MPEPLEVQLAILRTELAGLRQIVEGAKYIAEIANRNSERLAVHDERFLDVRDDIASLRQSARDIKDACNNLGNLIRETAGDLTRVRIEQEQVKDRQNQQAKVTTAAINGRYLVIAALVGGSVTIIVQLIAGHA